jgi:DNA gyrase inhibitor GyrI
MNDLRVRIVRLEPMRVAAAYGFGESPEMQAWEKIIEFARKKALLDRPQRPRFFGFNNPDPSPGSPNYGYEQWMEVDEGIEADGDIQIKDIPGAAYAVARFQGIENIGEMWKRLVIWGEMSTYKLAPRQILEELLSPIEDLDDPAKFVFDLYLPISE